MNFTTMRRLAGATFAFALAIHAPIASAAAPAVGTVIGNQATASYSDGGGNNFSATSGVVTSTVTQVASLTLTATQTKLAAQGQFVYFPHTLTNKGNGSDTFNLITLNNAAGNLANAVIYRDVNANGVVDVGDTVITSIQLAAGAQAALIVQTQTLTALGGSIDLTATSAFDGAKAITNTDTVTISTAAVINVLKGISVSSGAPGTEVTYTLTYQNNGNQVATNVVIADVIPAGFTYVAGSGKAGPIVLTDGDDAEVNPSGVTYKYVAGETRIAATIASVPVGGSAILQFKAIVNAGVTTGVINNTGYYCIADVNCTLATVGLGQGTPTNTVPFTVVQSTSVVLNGVTANATDGQGEPQTIASANQGATIVFNDYVHNTGNGTDKFNITVDSSTFPAGSSVQILKNDGATPLLDTNGDGIVDTGDLPVGGEYKVVVKVTLAGNAVGGPYKVVLKATSVVGDATTADNSNTMENVLTTIVANTVDLTNGPGKGVGVGTDTAITTTPVNPGAAATFVLQVTSGAVADTYTFSAGGDFVNAATPVNSNFSVAFYQDASAGHDCSALGGQVTGTGNINAGATGYFCGVVTSAANTPATTQAKVYFRVKSNTTGTADIKRDDVTVNAASVISLNPDNTQQAFPGGNVVYTHTLANNGNASETIAISKVDTNGLSSVVYIDTNGDGVLDAGDELFSAAARTLLQGTSVKIFVTVAVPSNTQIGTSSTTTLTATAVSGATDTATDTTNVVGGFINLVKTGKNDVACTGVLSDQAAFVKPSECLEYTVVATNNGSYSAESVVINDVVPAFTDYFTDANVPAASCVGSVGVAACTAAEAAGAVSTTAVILQPGQTVTLKFTVKVEGLAP